MWGNYSFSVSNLVVFQLQILAGDQKWAEVLQALLFGKWFLVDLRRERPAEKLWNWPRSFTWQNTETDLIAVDKQSLSHLVYGPWFQPIHQTAEYWAVFQYIPQIAVKLMIGSFLPLFQKTQSVKPAPDFARFKPHIFLNFADQGFEICTAITALRKINPHPPSLRWFDQKGVTTHLANNYAIRD